MVQQCFDSRHNPFFVVDQIEEKIDRIRIRIDSVEKKLDKIIGELDTIYIIEWLARACTVKDINYGMMALSC